MSNDSPPCGILFSRNPFRAEEKPEGLEGCDLTFWTVGDDKLVFTILELVTPRGAVHRVITQRSARRDPGLNRNRRVFQACIARWPDLDYQRFASFGADHPNLCDEDLQDAHSEAIQEWALEKLRADQ
jgi:hypothetical protein